MLKISDSTSTTPEKLLVWIETFEVFLISFNNPFFGLCFLNYLNYDLNNVCLVANDNFRSPNAFVKNASVPNNFIKIYKAL